jgi:F-type H+-transporting ATPase subunit epsilon
MAKARNLPAFPLKLITPAGVAFDGTVEQVTAVDPVGQFGVLADHVNFITSLVPGEMSVKLTDGRTLNYFVADGLAEVTNGAMTITVSELHELEAADKAVAAVKAAKQRLGELEAERAAAERALQMARANWHATELRRAAG